jgi:PAS domain S-box-containing protein
MTRHAGDSPGRLVAPPPRRPENLAARSMLLAAIVDSSDDAIISKTLDGVITTWNKAAERIYGYQADEMIGHSISLLISPDRASEMTELLDRIRLGERIDHYETTRRRKDGATIAISLTVSPIHDAAGGVVGASAIARDITDAQAQIRAHNEELEARVEQYAAELAVAKKNVESFTYSVAHDLASPLHALTGYGEALWEDYGDLLDDTGRRYLERIQAAPKVMAALINDLLVLAQVTNSEMSLEPVDLSTEVAAIAAELQAREPGRRVRFAIQAGVWGNADRIGIRSVLRNMVENAWKYTAKRDDATIEFGTTASEDARVCCYVRDDGVGFDPAYAGELFQPFRRLHGATEFPGTGVGLAGARRIIERHGGRVWAEGAVGAGATFYFTLDAKGTP